MIVKKYPNCVNSDPKSLKVFSVRVYGTSDIALLETGAVKLFFYSRLEI